MGKKKIKLISGIVAAALTCSVAFGGCSLISTDSAKDMKRTVAEVDISKTEAFNEEFKENAKYFDAIGSTEVIKRELITYFVTVGYSYMQNYGMSSAEVFNTLVDNLTQNAVLTQYATMYLLQKKTAEDANAFETFRNLSGEGHAEYEKYEYLLGENGDDVKLAKYSLMSSINSAIDSIEKDRILKYSETSSGSDTRTAPSNVDTQQDDYYPKLKESGNYVRPDHTIIKDDDTDKNYVLDYGVYTGYTTLASSGAYQNDRDEFLKENGTTASRVRAYTYFISSLISYNLIDEKKEDIRDVTGLAYYADEYVSQLKSRVINKYYDLYEEEQVDKLMSEDSYLEKVYEKLLKLQQSSYKTESDFSSAIGSMSDTSFILYAPEADDKEKGGSFGFVYNILLPYSASQSAKLKELQTLYADDEVDSGYSSKYYESRNQLLSNIKTTDQRRAWFDGSTEYAFEAEGKVDNYFGDSGWLFFENNLTDNDKYKPLDKYVGKYAYNGKVVKTEDGKYIFGAPVQLGIDDMLKEFTDYINYVLNGYTVGGANHVNFDTNYDATAWANNNGYYANTEFYTGEKNDDKQEQIDYSKFVYASGKVDFTADRANALNPDKANAQYWATAAVNELQYAYTTDTGVLSQYLGYTVEAGDTSYIKEFEYAAHQAVNNGTGSFSVCAGDYGWHLIYVTYTFDIAADNASRALYNPDWTKITTEGTFEYMFYEWVKDNDIEDISSTRQTQVINKYKKDKVTVKKYEKAYKNLTNLG